MTCLTFTTRRKLQCFVDFDRYNLNLSSDGQELIRSWFTRAWQCRDNFRDAQRQQYDFEHVWEPVQEYHRYFEAFSFLWFSFNSWAVCVTDAVSDKEYIETLIGSNTIDARTLHMNFKKLISDPQSPFEFYARQFANFWPIYDNRSLRDISFIEPREGTRKKVFEAYRKAYVNYLKANPNPRYKSDPQPLCWKEHEGKEESPPIDWAHTLPALYMVRCNLFHGAKSVNSQIHQRTVYSAFHTLLYFLISVKNFKGAWAFEEQKDSP